MRGSARGAAGRTPLNPITCQAPSHMTTLIAFLRAINVTGRYIKMQALAQAFHDLGFEDAKTHVNSGNVMFSAGARVESDVATELEAGLEPLLGFRAEVFLRSLDEIRQITDRAHGLGATLPEGGEVNVCFLPVPVSPAQREILTGLRSEADDFEAHGRELYWLCRTRQSASKFSNAVLERRFKCRSTLRRASMLRGLVAAL